MDQQLGKQAALNRMKQISISILGRPEFNIDQISDIHSFCAYKDKEIVAEAIEIELFVLSDLIPGYRIRVQEEDESKLSAGVKQLRKYERKIILHYQRFLKLLETFLADQILSQPAAKALCSLLVSQHHFNFFLNMIKVVVPLICRPQLTLIVTDALQTLFETDAEQYSSLAVVEYMEKFLQDRIRSRKIQEKKALKKIKNASSAFEIKQSQNHYKNRENQIVPQEFFTCLQSIRIRNTLNNPKQKSKQKDQQEIKIKLRGERPNKRGVNQTEKQQTENQKENMSEKIGRELQRDLAEAEAVQSVEQKQKVGTSLLRCVVRVYSIALDASPQLIELSTTVAGGAGNRQIVRELIVPALQGLSRIAHHLNVQLVSDLLLRIRLLLDEQNQSQDEIVENEKEIKLSDNQQQKQTIKENGKGKKDKIDQSAKTDQQLKTNSDYTPQLLLDFESTISLILASLNIMTLHADALQVDQRILYCTIYRLLPSWENIPLIIQCLDALAVRSGNLSSVRCMAFVKRLLQTAVRFSQTQSSSSSTSLQLATDNTAEIAAILQCVRAISKVCQNVQQMFRGETKCVVFREDIDDPDFCGAEGADVVSELDTLLKYPEAGIRQLVVNILTPNTKESLHSLSQIPSETYKLFQKDKVEEDNDDEDEDDVGEQESKQERKKVERKREEAISQGKKLKRKRGEDDEVEQGQQEQKNMNRKRRRKTE